MRSLSFFSFFFLSFLLGLFSLSTCGGPSIIALVPPASARPGWRCGQSRCPNGLEEMECLCVSFLVKKWGNFDVLIYIFTGIFRSGGGANHLDIFLCFRIMIICLFLFVLRIFVCSVVVGVGVACSSRSDVACLSCFCLCFPCS